MSNVGRLGGNPTCDPPTVQAETVSGPCRVRLRHAEAQVAKNDVHKNHQDPQSSGADIPGASSCGTLLRTRVGK